MTTVHTQWDVVVVGTGMGGATLGRALAEAGRRVLFVERGQDLRRSATDVTRGRFVEDSPEYRGLNASSRHTQLEQGGRNSETAIDGVHGDAFLPFVGSGTGGSTGLYGMVLERLFPFDMTEERGWPITYGHLQPWYEAAERLFRVRGTADPIRGEGGMQLLEPPPLSRGNAALDRQLRQRGLHPYRLHLACERVSGCTMCQGYLCRSDERCKNDALQTCLVPALDNSNAGLLTDARVTALDADDGRVKKVWAVHQGSEIALEARVVVLAAGALITPRILLSSAGPLWPRGLANHSGTVGRHLMRHAIDLYVLQRADPLEGPAEAKEIGFNDLYALDGLRLGTVQSFGWAPPFEYLRNQPGVNVWRWLGPVGAYFVRHFAAQPIMASILEDLPNQDNRVSVNDGRLTITYRLGKDAIKRRAILRRAVRDALRPLGPICVSGTDDRKALGHVCGTCRMGDDRRTSVVDRWNRAHDVDNLYVADASFFPTSGGINPALTIAANALRIAREIDGRL